MGNNVDGIAVCVNGESTLQVAKGQEFTFELSFYDTAKPRQIRIWFNLDDLKDDRWENDPIVPASKGKGDPKDFILIE